MQVVEVTQMQWEESCGLQPDIVLAADVLYDPGQLHRQCLVTELSTHVSSSGVVQYSLHFFPVHNTWPCAKHCNA